VLGIGPPLISPPLPREWYSYHFPELARIVGDNIVFARLAQLIGRRSSITDAM